MGGRDGGDFFITQGGTLYFRSLPDYDRPADSDRDNVYEVTIQPSDGRVLGSYPVTVTVTDVNEAAGDQERQRDVVHAAREPHVPAVHLQRNGSGGRSGDLVRGWHGRETSSPSTSAGSSPSRRRTRRTSTRPGDVGEDNLYNVTIQARDPESNTASLSVTVTVTEVNEGPVITRQGSAPGSVPENHGAEPGAGDVHGSRSRATVGAHNGVEHLQARMAGTSRSTPWANCASATLRTTSALQTRTVTTCTR